MTHSSALIMLNWVQVHIVAILALHALLVIAVVYRIELPPHPCVVVAGIRNVLQDTICQSKVR